MDDFIKEKVKQTLLELGFDLKYLSKASFERPKKEKYGDFSTNIAFLISGEIKTSPAEVAKKISRKLSELKEFRKVDAVNGFINFFLSKEFYIDMLKQILNTEFYTSNIGKGEKVIVEYVSANPTGPLHIGHGRGAVVGDVLTRLLKLTGFNPIREFYINDSGRQIKLLGESVYARMKEIVGDDSVEFPEDGYRGEYIVEIAKEMIDNGLTPDKISPERTSVYAKEKLLEEIKNDLARLKVSFDSWFSEKYLFESGEVGKVIKVMDKKGLTYEKDGALWLKTSLFGDDKDRVIRKSDGNYTYFASDIAYHYNKISRGYDFAINIWGADHHGYIGRIKAAIRSFGKSEDWLEVLLVQLVKLYQGGKEIKMSKRSGKFITLRELMDKVGVDAVRFFFLLKRHDTPLDFDLDLAISKSNENPVYYVQYAHARLCSIMEKAKEKDITPDNGSFDMLDSKDEHMLIAQCYRLRNEVKLAALKREPHRITYYLLDLASSFHKFYNKHRIIDSKNIDRSKSRLLLAMAVKKTLKAGLDILNVSAPRRM